MSAYPRAALAAGLCLAALTSTGPARADLLDYVKKADAAFSWKLKERTEFNGNLIYEIDLVSQKWHDIDWDHKLLVYLPRDQKPGSTMVLMNTGGTPKTDSHLLGLALARQCQAPVAILFGVPKQPLFDGKKEDALIAETFVRYLKDRDDSWPLLFPMVKSVVKAMDALQAFSKDEWKEPIKDFIVTGGSKRGWTAWLTAATGDKRVKAIAPMVIDVLNMVEQMKHQLHDFGKPSDMIHDYVERRLVPLPDSDDARRLWRMVDPYSYRDQLTLPKLILLGNNDPYWTTDALNLYWDGLKGDKWICYIPNAGHDLQQDGKPDRTRALSALAAFTRHLISGKPMPILTWDHRDGPEGKLSLTIGAKPAPKSVRLWTASAPTRDFRKAKWEQGKPLASRVYRGEDADASSVTLAEVKPPQEGCLAFYGNLEYEIGGLTYHLSTQIRIAGEPEKKP